jgi:cystathionine beta-lyase
MTGVVSGLNNFCQAFKSDYPTVVVQTPVYPPILHAPGVAGMNRIEVPFIRQADGRYAVDLDTLEQAFSRGRSLFILCNPQNPTGRVFEQTELEAIADLCDRYDVLVCADEIHSDLVFAPHKHIPFASLRQSSPERTITFAAPSKTFNIAGLGCAYAVIPSPELRERFKRQAEAFSGHINALGLTAGLAAYKTGGEWLESLLTYLTENRQLMQDFFKAELPDVGFYPPEGTYLAWLDFSRLDISDLAAFLLEKGAVAVNPGLDFGNPGARFVRLNFGCPRLLLEDGLSRISRALLANR